MLSRWYDIDRELAVLEDLQRRFERGLAGSWSNRAARGVTALTGGWPQANLYDNGSSLVAMISVPGLGEQDLNVEVQGDVFTLSGERKGVPRNTSPHLAGLSPSALRR